MPPLKGNNRTVAWKYSWRLCTDREADAIRLVLMTTFQLYLAPLRGFTDYIYRNTFAGHFDGFDGALAPFIPTVTADRFKPSHFKDVLPENNSTIPIVPQIISNQPDD